MKSRYYLNNMHKTNTYIAVIGAWRQFISAQKRNTALQKELTARHEAAVRQKIIYKWLEATQERKIEK